MNRSKELSPIRILITSGVAAIAAISLWAQDGWVPPIEAQTIPGSSIPGGTIPTETSTPTGTPEPIDDELKDGEDRIRYEFRDADGNPDQTAMITFPQYNELTGEWETQQVSSVVNNGEYIDIVNNFPYYGFKQGVLDTSAVAPNAAETGFTILSDPDHIIQELSVSGADDPDVSSRVVLTTSLPIDQVVAAGVSGDSEDDITVATGKVTADSVELTMARSAHSVKVSDVEQGAAVKAEEETAVTAAGLRNGASFEVTVDENDPDGGTIFVSDESGEIVATQVKSGVRTKIDVSDESGRTKVVMTEDTAGDGFDNDEPIDLTKPVATETPTVTVTPDKKTPTPTPTKDGPIEEETEKIFLPRVDGP